ncbi:FUN14 domain-containing protein [bacterium]|nr:FUN14 domain-containing protein [bacterium]
MNEQVAAVVKSGWFESLKSKLNLDGIIQKMNLSRNKLIEFGLYLGAGLIVGFLFKKYAKYLLVVLLTIVCLGVLQQFKFIDVVIHWDKIQGIQPISVVQGGDVWSLYWEWLKANFMVVLSFSVGFFVGFKVG